MLANTSDVGRPRFSLSSKPRTEYGMGMRRYTNAGFFSVMVAAVEVYTDPVIPACSRCTKACQASGFIYSDDAVEVTQRSAKTTHTDNQACEELLTTQIVLDVSSSETMDNLVSKLKYKESRIKQHETVLAKPCSLAGPAVFQCQGLSRAPLTPQFVQKQEIRTSINDRETMLLREKSYAAQFSGTTHSLALIAHIPNLSLFTKEAIEAQPAFKRVD